jgi:hypothetical protein
LPKTYIAKLIIGIQFLIESDSVTSANRESVIDCPWNEAIYNGVARAFVSAVSGTFAKSDHLLRYSWLDYLPTHPMEHPWTSLPSLIQDSLTTKPVLQTWQGRLFKAPTQVRRLRDCTFHQKEPILRDLTEEIYLAPEYTSRHTDSLDALGVNFVDWEDLVDRLQQDSGPESKLKTLHGKDPWHEAFANLFLLTFADSSEDLQVVKRRIKKLPIIPLMSPNQWTGAPGISKGGSLRIYFAFTGRTPIPKSLPLTLLDANASAISSRKEFCRALEVEDCPKATVFAKIKETHHGGLAPDASDLLSHFRYLFCQQCKSDDIKTWICVPSNAGHTKACSGQLYFPSEAEYDTCQLLQEHTGAAEFLSESLVGSVSSEVRVGDEDWKSWLARIRGARYGITLLCSVTLAPHRRGRYRRSYKPYTKTTQRSFWVHSEHTGASTRKLQLFLMMN